MLYLGRTGDTIVLYESSGGGRTLRIPAQFQPYYQDWKDLVVNFNLRDMG